MNTKIIEFPCPACTTGTIMTEVFRCGALAIHVELPQSTYRDAERAAQLSGEPVSRLVGRLARRISDDQNGERAIARRH